MGSALHLFDLDAAEARVHPHTEDAVILGMPHLCIAGLSETWLVKELGHRHWQLLAKLAGRDTPDFRDTDGRAVYAAFNAVSSRDLNLGMARENDRLTFKSSIGRLSRTQFRSEHALSLNGVFIGTVELISVFVKRMVAGRNRSAVRVDIAGLPPVASGEHDICLVNEAAGVRKDQWTTHMGFAQADARQLARHEIDPCPMQDFNGAGFLYCATFQSFVDRAEWQFRRDPNVFANTVERDVIFRGNIEAGERIAVSMLAMEETDNGFRHWCRITRVGDEQVLADVFTRRVFASELCGRD